MKYEQMPFLKIDDILYYCNNQFDKPQLVRVSTTKYRLQEVVQLGDNYEFAPTPDRLFFTYKEALDYQINLLNNSIKYYEASIINHQKIVDECASTVRKIQNELSRVNQNKDYVDVSCAVLKSGQTLLTQETFNERVKDQKQARKLKLLKELAELELDDV